MKRINLKTFLLGSANPEDGYPGCANYDREHHECVVCNLDCSDRTKCQTCPKLFNSRPCLVMNGETCRYFERAVLPTAREIGLADCIYGQYEQKVGLKRHSLPRGEVRGCPDCGESLGFRQKYCRKCAGRRRRETNRKNQRKFRQTVRV